MDFYEQLWHEILVQLFKSNKLIKQSKELLNARTIVDNKSLYVYTTYENIQYLKNFIGDIEIEVEKKLGRKLKVFFEIIYQEVGGELDKQCERHLTNWSKKFFYHHSSCNYIFKFLEQRLPEEHDECLYYIWGNEGIGKTHLIIHLLNHIKKQHSEFKFLYVDIFEFSNKFYKYFKYGNTQQEFVKTLLTYDLIVFDDLYIIKDRENITNVIFSIISEFIKLKKKIVLINTSKNILLNGIDKKVVSLIKNSCIFNVQEPTTQDVNMMIYMFFKENNKNIKITGDAVKYLSSILGTNLSVIIERLTKLTMFFENPSFLKVINLENLKKILEKMSFFKKTKDLRDSSNNSHLKTICEKLNIDINEIKGNSRKKNIVLNRNIVIYIFKKKLNFSHISIGEILNKDHSTISHSLKKVEEKLKEKSFKEYFDLLVESIF